MNAKISPRTTGLRQKAQLMSASEIERTLVRLAYEIVEKNGGGDGLGLGGIRRRGGPIPEGRGKVLSRTEKPKVPVGPRAIPFIETTFRRWGLSRWCRRRKSDSRLRI